MSEWKKCKLGDHVFINVHNIDRNYLYDEIEYLDTGNITNGRIDSYQCYKLKEAPSRAKRIIKNNDVILSMVRPIQRHYGYMRNIKPNTVASTGFVVLSSKDSIDPYYLYLLVTQDNITEYLDIVAEGSTSAYPSFTPDILEDLSIFLPPLPEQCAIAAVLSSLDDKIDLLHRQNKTLEAMAEALWRKMFIEDVSNTRIISLGEIIDIYDSERIPLSSMQRVKMKEGILYPYYGAASILDYINQYIFNGEFLLLGEDGTVENEDGYPSLQLVTGKFWANNHTHVLQAKSPFSNFLLYIILKNTTISHIVTGAVQPKINQENLKSLEIVSADNKVISKISESFEIFWSKIQSDNISINQLSCIRDTLLPKLISGEVRVKYG